MINIFDYKINGFIGKHENIELALYCVIAFFIPFLFSHPQIITGSLVNMFLILSAMHIKGKKSMIIAIIPSISALLRGALFGNLTFLLIYIMPFIWIGNIALILLFKYFLKGKINYFLTLIISAIIKTSIISLGAYILFMNNIFPKVLLVSFSTMQITTCVIGGLIAYLRFALK